MDRKEWICKVFGLENFYLYLILIRLATYICSKKMHNSI